jgi:putative intracellular protease/amidase
MGAKRILMLVGDYVEDYEAMVPFQALAMVGHTVHAACPWGSIRRPPTVFSTSSSSAAVRLQTK